MLTRIKLTNFKSWRELDIELAPLTILFGTNSSGKSSALQSLLLLKQTVNSFDRKQHINFGGNDRDYIDFGSYRDLAFGHDEFKKVGIGLSWIPQFRYSAISYEVSWFHKDENVLISKLSYIDEQSPVSLIQAEYKDDETYNLLIGDSNEEQPISSFPPENCYLMPNYATYQNKKNKMLGYMKEVNSKRFHSLFESLIENILYLGPLRDHPHRTYPLTGSSPTIIERSGESTIAVLISSERKGENLLIQVSEWLAKMGLVDKFKVEALDSNKRFYETKVKIGEAESSLLDVGFGVSQILPVITLLLFAPEGSIILLEQPELHLHPRAQAHLADLFLYVAEKRKLQLIVESHSEHLLRRLQRRVAETEHPFANPENLKMYFCQSGENGSQIQPVDIDKYGQIKNWPEDFFGDILGDLDAMTDAALAERRRELEGG